MPDNERSPDFDECANCGQFRLWHVDAMFRNLKRPMRECADFEPTYLLEPMNVTHG